MEWNFPTICVCKIYAFLHTNLPSLNIYWQCLYLKFICIIYTCFCILQTLCISQLEICKIPEIYLQRRRHKFLLITPIVNFELKSSSKMNWVFVQPTCSRVFVLKVPGSGASQFVPDNNFSGWLIPFSTCLLYFTTY